MVKRLRGLNLSRYQQTRPHALIDYFEIEPCFRGTYRQPQTPCLKDSSCSPISSLPHEILLMILWYLVPSQRWVAITSQPRKDKQSYLRIHEPLFALTHSLFSTRLTNKAFYQAASFLYYTENTFVFCNGPWGCTENPNLHALQKFVSTIPKGHLAMIRSLRMGLFIRRGPYARDKINLLRNPFHPAFTFDAEGILKMARMVNKWFPGIEWMRLYIGQPFNGYSRNERWGWFVKQEMWVKFVKLLLQLRKLKRINVLEKNVNLWKNLEDIVEREGLKGRVSIPKMQN